MSKIPGEIPPTVIVLAAEPYEAPGQFPTFHDGMYLGAQSRFDAAAEIAATGAVERMILVGGYNIDPAKGLYESDKTRDMADHIGRKAAKNVVLEQIRSLPCTHHNFIAICHQWARENNWPSRVGLLSSAWHIPRSLIFGEMAFTEFGHAGEVELVPLVGEDIMGLDINKVVVGHEEEYDRRMQGEVRGIVQIEDGTYRDSCLTKKGHLLKPLLADRGSELLSPTELDLAA